MKIFVTGATGFVGMVVVEELLQHGHQVIGLVRRQADSDKLTRLGASVHLGSLEDLDSLKSAASKSDGVINCAFNNDLSKFGESIAVEKKAIEAIGQCLAGSNRPFIVTSGVALLTPGRVGTEDDPVPANSMVPRNPEDVAFSFVEQNVRSMVVRLSPTTHGHGEGGFAGLLSSIARVKKESAYIENGENRWSAVHHRDAATLYRLALEKGSAGSRYHAVAEEAVVTKDIAKAISEALNVPLVSKSGKAAEDYFGAFRAFASLDILASSEITKRTLGWQPTNQNLIDDLRKNLNW